MRIGSIVEYICGDDDVLKRGKVEDIDTNSYTHATLYYVLNEGVLVPLTIGEFRTVHNQRKA